MTKQTDDLFDDEVTTGATLDSGTTIGGNAAFHLGNDGQGSGLDVETVDGSEPVQKGQKYTKEDVVQDTGNQGAIISQFATPSSGQQGIDSDSNSCIWISDATSDVIYQLDRVGSIKSQFSTPGTATRGLTIDSENSIWSVDVTDNSIYKFNRSGSKLDGVSTGGICPPLCDPISVVLDSNESIFTNTGEDACIYKINQNESIITSFSTPSSKIVGIDFDFNTSLWYADGNDSIYKLTKGGTVISVISTPGPSPKGLGIDSTDCIWHTDSNENSVYQIDSGQEFLGTKLEKL